MPMTVFRGSGADLIKGDWVLFHPVYSPKELTSVEVKYRTPKTLSDRIASSFVHICRLSFDFVSGYKDKPMPIDKKLTLKELREQGYVMNDAQWLKRIIFLESIAGVPGMVAAMLRHLRSLRLMRRDGGWIHSLLEEAENERMHLMTFMTLKKPSIFFRAMILGAQGVFFNAFFLAYLVSPRTCHRFVGYLEEQAVFTYTHAIQELEAGYLPEWESKPAPGIAIEYWRLPENATMRDVLYAVRSDETTHRFVNHSLANLEKGDANPFALREPDMTVKGTTIEFDRAESERYVRESQQLWETEKHDAELHHQHGPLHTSEQK
ncbi:alternative oxidase [Vararia minispora EC-137]|uniref:Alternative oxidase n=1 Tax=Vararia minispora EC-137 TaxID=1314806 RepID=A0ACB8QI08_9AGAM|nr:alternative oxidase [Vararia minispora EC-137]